MEQLAKAPGVDPDYAIGLLQTRKSLVVLHAELMRYNDILTEFRKALQGEQDALMVRYRPYLQKPFFDHCGYLVGR